MKPLISVIIPVYNVEKYLVRCLDSVLAQSFTDYEIICVNDASTDASNKILLEFEKKDSRIQVVQNEKNSGQSFTRNVGLKLAKGKYVVFLDSDDAIVPECLRKIYDKAEQTNADILFFGAREIEEGKKDNYYTFTDEICSKVWNGQRLFVEMKRTLGIVPPTMFKLWRKEFLIRFNLYFYEGIYHEDVLLTFLVLMYAQNVVCIPDLLYLYYRREGSIMRRKLNFKYVESLVVIIDEMYKTLKSNTVDQNLRNEVLNEMARLCIYLKRVMIRVGVRHLPETSKLFDCEKQDLYMLVKFSAIQQYWYSFSEDDIVYLKSFEHILVYGAGKVAKKVIFELLDNCIEHVEVVVTSKKDNQDSIYNFPVKEIGSLDYPKDRCVVIIAVGKTISGEVQESVTKIGYKNFIHF